MYMFYKKILVPVDFSAITKDIIEWVQVLKEFKAEEVILLHVIDNGAKNNGVITEVNARLKLKQYSDVLEVRGITSKVVIATGIPSLEIVKAATQENATMILMGAHGKGIFKRMIAGSTAFNVVRMSDIPVL